MNVNVDTEYGILTTVLLASPRSFHLHEPINNVQRRFYASSPPRPDALIRQHHGFAKLLEDQGVTVLWTTVQSESPVQYNVRDVASTIGSTFIVCSMKEPLRRHEPFSLEDILRAIETPILHVDAGTIEGGDVMLDRDSIYVGISERTNKQGADWIIEHFSGRFAVCPIQLTPPYIHLDVVFNLLGGGIALVYPPAINPSSFEVLSQRYSLIEVTAGEQFVMGVNVLSLSPDTVVADKRQSRLNDLLRERGFEVLELEFDEVTKVGGSFRCACCPLVRKSVG